MIDDFETQRREQWAELVERHTQFLDKQERDFWWINWAMLATMAICTACSVVCSILFWWTKK